MPKRFFLTHSSKDKPLVLRVGRALGALGYTVWIDKYEIKAGDSLTRKIFTEGLQRTDYLAAFITRSSARSKWVREELEFAFHRSVEEGKPKIVMLQFGQAAVPTFLKHRHYAALETHEIGEVVRTILASANLPPMNNFQEAKPYATLDFHDALTADSATYFLASRKDPLDVEVYRDKEGILFPLRNIFALRLDHSSRSVTQHYLTQARISHTAMRVIGDNLLIFFNAKFKNHDFAMDGTLYRLNKATLVANSVNDVFAERNWGWDPYIDENALVHHKDSETTGNPYMIGDTVIPEKDRHELWDAVREWRNATCPYPTLEGPGRDTGYLRFLDIDPANTFG